MHYYTTGWVGILVVSQDPIWWPSNRDNWKAHISVSMFIPYLFLIAHYKISQSAHTINKWKSNMVHIYNEIVFKHRKEQSNVIRGETHDTGDRVK